MERVLEAKFEEFPPKEVVSLLLSFVYIEKYPLNFVKRVFNPYFMDRLHSQVGTKKARSPALEWKKT